MMNVPEIRRWLDTLKDTDFVGVDEGGLCLRVNSEDSEEYLEIGGMPLEHGGILAAEIFGPEGELNAKVYSEDGVFAVERTSSASEDDIFATLEDLEDSLAAGYRLSRKEGQ